MPRELYDDLMIMEDGKDPEYSVSEHGIVLVGTPLEFVCEFVDSKIESKIVALFEHVLPAFAKAFPAMG